MLRKMLAGLGVALSVVACSAEDVPAKVAGGQQQGSIPTIAAGTGAPAAAAGSSVTSGFSGSAGTGALPSSGSSGLSGVNNVPAGGPAPGGQAGPGSLPAQTGGPGMVAAAGTGAMPMNQGGPDPTMGAKDPPPASATDPVIPEINGDCPPLENGTISFGGVSGISIASGPMPSSPTAPMVFYWHGTGSTSGEYSLMAAAVAQGVQQEGGVLVSFQNSSGGDLLSGTNVFGKGDLDIVDQFVACAVKNRNVDPHRIFATGCSAGGLFTGAMGALRSNYVAAVAPNSGGFTTPGIAQFQGPHAPALMTVHGQPGQDVVIIDFSDASATADMAYKAAGAFVINCNHGGGHCGGGGLAGDIWTFFEAHPFGVSPEPWANGLPSGFSQQCMIYSN